MKMLIRPFWQKLFKSTWILGLVLIFTWGIPRFAIVLSANVTGNYNLVSLIFVSMCVAPWIFLTRSGRQKMGLRKPARWDWLIFGLFAGILLCGVMYLLVIGLYGQSIDNWFVYISRSYSNIPDTLSQSDLMIYFAIYAVIGMTFSPIGEELFYRGMVHECFAERWGNPRASIIDGLAFSLTHLAHFGIIYQMGSWSFRALPAILWVSMLFGLCLVFSLARRKSGSIWGAVLAHAGFNLAMMYFIFFYIL